jgi:hypothetical protein
MVYVPVVIESSAGRNGLYKNSRRAQWFKEISAGHIGL